MRSALFFSGGKDAFHCLGREEGITHLLTSFDEEARRLPIQGIRIDVIRAQARALGLPLVEVPLPPGADNATYVAGVGAAVRAHGLQRLVFGDLYLADIRAFRERAFGPLGAELRFPLWGSDTRELAREMIAAGIEARVCSVAPGLLDAALLGRSWDAAFLADLPPAVDPCGERGEFHTLVSAAPGMPALAVAAGAIVGSMGYQVLDYRLAGA